MKSNRFFILALVLAAVLTFSGALQSVQAAQLGNNPGPTPIPTNTPTDIPTATTVPEITSDIADGDWTSGSVVSVDLTKTKNPKGGLQMLGDAVNVTKFGRICHPFHGGQYGWTGSIYQLIGSKWYGVTTYFIWSPDSEGTFMACANVSSHGTYAFFGTFDDTRNPTATMKPTATATQTPTPSPTAKPTTAPIGQGTAKSRV